MKEGPNQALLTGMLAVAIPMWVEQLKKRPFAELLARGGGLADIIATKGDVLQFGGGKKGETGAAFNALAEALAILSFFPGGVTFAGDHYENKHPDAG